MALNGEKFNLYDELHEAERVTGAKCGEPLGLTSCFPRNELAPTPCHKAKKEAYWLCSMTAAFTYECGSLTGEQAINYTKSL